MTTPIEAIRSLPEETLRELAALQSDEKPRESGIAKQKLAELDAAVEALYAELTEADFAVFDAAFDYLKSKGVIGHTTIPERNGISVDVSNSGLDFHYRFKRDGDSELWISSHISGVCTFHVETVTQYTKVPVDKLVDRVRHHLAVTLDEHIAKIDQMIIDTHQTPGWTKGTNFEYK